MELTPQQKNKILIGVIATLLIATAIVIGVYQNKKQQDLETLSSVTRIRSALTLVYSINNHYPIATVPIIVPSSQDKSEKLCVTGFYGAQEPCGKIILQPIPTTIQNPWFTYSTDAKGNTYQFEFTLQTQHRDLGLSNGIICTRESGLSLGSCNQ